MSRALLMQGLVLKSLCSDSGEELPDCCIQRWRATWCAQCMLEGINADSTKTAWCRGVSMTVSSKTPIRKNELVKDTFVARIRWGAVVVSAANTNTHQRGRRGDERGGAE